MKKAKQLNSKFKKHTVSPAYEVYINSLAIGGRKGMVSMLGQACRILGWQQAPAYYPWHQLSFQKLHQVRAKMLELEYGLNSVNLTLSGMRGIAKTAFNLEMLSGEQLMRIQAVQVVRGEVLRKGRSLDENDIKKLLNACSTGKTKTMAARDKAILLVSCGAGLRISETIALRVSDVNFIEGKINILNGKGRKQRSISLAKPVVDSLSNWVAMLPDNNGCLFREVRRGGSVRKNGLSKQGITKIIKRLQKSALVDAISPHDLRRCFITNLIQDGNDINSVRQLAGHSNITTTALYDRRDSMRLLEVSRNIGFLKT